MREKYEHFQILRKPDGTLWELGRGTLGITYKALDTNLRAEVALKVIHLSALGDAASREAFIQATRTSAALRHANVVTIFHLGEEGSECFIAMELVLGQTLDSRLQEGKMLPLREVCEIGLQVARALVAAEALGLHHGDIRPANLMLLRDDDGRPLVKLMDFGMARAGVSKQEFASDLYALGTTLQGAFVGVWPPDLQNLMDGMLTSDPAKRLTSASAVRQRLSAYLALPEEILPPPLPPLAPPPTKKAAVPKSLIWLVALGLVVLMVMLAISIGVASLLPRFQALASTAPASPTPALAPASTPTVIPPTTPAPTPTLSPLEKLLAQAADLHEQEKYGPALESYVRIATQFPSDKTARERMEMIAAFLRSNGFAMNATTFSSLRKPLTLAASHDVVSAQILLGEQLRRAEPADSLKWFSAAAENGQTEAMTQAGLMLANRRGTSAPNLALAVRWFEKAAAAGDVEAMAALAECLIYGKGTTKNTPRAIELLFAASAFKNPRAINLLGDLAFRGDGMPQNYPEALRLFTEASDLGDGEALANLGVLHMRGAGVKKNPQKAVSLWKLGAEQGFPACMVNYAKALDAGVGTSRQKDESRRWFIEAAILGNIAAMEWCEKNQIPY